MQKGQKVHDEGKASSSWVRLPLSILQMKLSARAQITLALLIDRQRLDGTVHVKAEQLAETMRVSLRTVQAAIKELKEAGFITSVDGRGRTSPVYTLIQVIEPKKRRY